MHNAPPSPLKTAASSRVIPFAEKFRRAEPFVTPSVLRRAELLFTEDIWLTVISHYNLENSVYRHPKMY